MNKIQYVVEGKGLSFELTNDEQNIFNTIYQAGTITVSKISKQTSIYNREVTWLINDLRNKGVPIIGNKNGVHLAKTLNEVKHFCAYLKHRAESNYKSIMKTRKILLDKFNINQEAFFDSKPEGNQKQGFFRKLFNGKA